VPDVFHQTFLCLAQIGSVNGPVFTSTGLHVDYVSYFIRSFLQLTQRYTSSVWCRWLSYSMQFLCLSALPFVLFTLTLESIIGQLRLATVVIG